VVWLVEVRNAISFVTLFPLFNAFDFFFIIVASMIPVGMASYSIVGEKVEKSLERCFNIKAVFHYVLSRQQ
jgi:hypothetical protein